jgi:hypothetical protein
LLIHQLPPKPTNLRVRVWRKLQKLGAVTIKNSVYVLPASDKTNEDFQWLKQEIQTAGGEAAVFRADAVEGATDKEIIAAFRRARDDEFAELTSQFQRLARSIREQTRGKHLSAGRLAALESDLTSLHTELDRVRRNDFFDSRGRSAAVNGYEQALKLLRSGQSPIAKAGSSPANFHALAVEHYQGRRWVTRRDIHIDRLASALLIKQFIDKKPRFYFVADGETVDNAIPFDMFGAEFTHHGEDCTFETLVKRFGLTYIKGLVELGQIVHDVDLKDDKFHRLEAAGLKVMIDGLSATTKDDRKRLQRASIIFDTLFAQLDKPSDKKAKRRKTSARNKRP